MGQEYNCWHVRDTPINEFIYHLQSNSVVNCGIGVSLFDATDLKHILGVYLALALCTFLLLVVLFFVFTIIAITVRGEGMHNSAMTLCFPLSSLLPLSLYPLFHLSLPHIIPSLKHTEGSKLGPAMVKPILTYWFQSKGNEGSTIQMATLQNNPVEKNTAQRSADTSLGSNSGESPKMTMVCSIHF